MDASKLAMAAVYILIGVILSVMIGFIGLSIILIVIATLIPSVLDGFGNINATSMSFASFFATGGPVQLLFGGLIVISIIILIVVLVLGSIVYKKSYNK